MTFSSLSALQRAQRILDDGSFEPLHEVSEGSVLVAGSGFLAGAPVVLALTDGHVRGGTIGVAEAGALVQLADTVFTGRVHSRRPVALIVGFDTGGVRVEEGPRALAAASALGVALARLSLLGVPLASVISGPRGCFGATAVMAALPERVIMTSNANWGLTGPRLFGSSTTSIAAGQHATSGEMRLANGDAHAVVDDDADAIRTQLCDFIARAQSGHDRRSVAQHLASSADILAAMRARLKENVALTPNGDPTIRRRRQRDLLRYSFRGQWKPSGVVRREGIVHAAIGTLGERPALSLIVGPEGSRGNGIGIAEAATVAEMVRIAATGTPGDRAAILTFLFCQGHVVDVEQERLGLPRALAECLRAMVAARLLGHPIVSVLGGGTYGAAYLALAAPSHRILAMRGTSVAPMAPQVLQAFQALRGHKSGQEAQVAELIPDIRIVESVIRLPRVLREEFIALLATVRPEVDAA